MKTAKEVTIKYLKSIYKDRQNSLDTCDFSKTRPAGIRLLMEVETINRAIKIVEESEGE